MVNDSHIPWVRKRKLFQLNELFLLEEPASGIQTSAIDASIILKEVAATGTVGFVFADTKGVRAKLTCPHDLDPRFEVGFRVVYTLNHDGSDPAVATWVALCDAIGVGVEIGGAATTALDKLIPAHTYVNNSGVASTTDDLLQVTARGIKKSLGLTRAQIEELAFIKITLSLTTVTNATDLIFLGILMDYAPRKTVGMGSNLDAPLNSSLTL